MKTLMLSKRFPVTHPAAGASTLFLQAVKRGDKIHTIRENKTGRYKTGDLIEIRQWSDLPYRSKQEYGLTVCIGVEPVAIVLHSGGLTAAVNGIPVDVRRLALNDGLSLDDFTDWFFPRRKPGTFTGSIIHFTSFRYAKKVF